MRVRRGCRSRSCPRRRRRADGGHDAVQRIAGRCHVPRLSTVVHARHAPSPGPSPVPLMHGPMLCWCADWMDVLRLRNSCVSTHRASAAARALSGSYSSLIASMTNRSLSSASPSALMGRKAGERVSRSPNSPACCASCWSLYPAIVVTILRIADGCSMPAEMSGISASRGCERASPSAAIDTAMWPIRSSLGRDSSFRRNALASAVS